MSCPDYYRLVDGREFWEFYRDECAPLVADKLNDGEKHALQSACEHLFRAGLKGSLDDDLDKASWWLDLCKDEFQPDMSDMLAEDYSRKVMVAYGPVLDLVSREHHEKLFPGIREKPSISIPADCNGTHEPTTKEATP